MHPNITQTGKFSKSRGLGVFGDDAARAGLSPDVWRFYLLSSRPETSDTDFKWSDLAARTNAELLANLGNFCHRALSFTASKLGGVVPRSAAELLGDASSSPSPAAAALAGREAVAAAAAAATDLSSKVAPLAASYLAAMEKAKLREGARLLMVRVLEVLFLVFFFPSPPFSVLSSREAESRNSSRTRREKTHKMFSLSLSLSIPQKKKKNDSRIQATSAAGNKFLQEHAPWELMKKKKAGEGDASNGNGAGGGGGESDPGRAAAGVLLRAALGLVALLSGMASPFVPAAAASLRVQLGLDDEAVQEGEGGSGGGGGGARVSAATAPSSSPSSSGSSANDPFAGQSPLGEERVAAASRDLSALLKEGAPLGTPAVLFRAIPPEEVAALRARFGGAGEAEGGDGAAGAGAAAPAAKKKGGKPAAAASAAPGAGPAPKKPAKKPKTPPEDPNAPVTLSRLDLRVGVVLEARRHPGAEKLYVEKIDLGEAAGPRQVVSGLVDHVPLDKFVGSRVVCVCNARASVMRGEESQAMLLAATATAASSEGGGEGGEGGGQPPKVEVVSPPAGAAPGARVFVATGEGEGLAASPDAEIDLRKSVAWPAIREELRIDGEGRATYRGQLLRVEGCPEEGAREESCCFAETVRGGSVG